MFLKVVLMLLVALGASAQTPSIATPVPLFSWTNTTAGGPTFKRPLPGASSCAPDQTILSNYVTYTATFSTSGVRQIAALAELTFKPNFAVFLYNGPFNPAASCTNLVRQLINSNFPDPYYGKGGLAVDDYYNFLSTVTYTFVVTSNTVATGIFGLEVRNSQVVGSTVGGTSIVWKPANLNPGYCSTVGTQSQNASVFTIAPLSAGYYDVAVFFELLNSDPNVFPTTYFAIYEGVVAAANLSVDACNPAYNRSLRFAGSEGDRSTVGLAQNFLQTQATYTVVVSSTYAGNWGFWFVGTRIKGVGAIQGFNQPNPSIPCVNSSSANAAYLTLSAPNAIGTYTLIDTSTVIPDYNDWFAWFNTRTFGYTGAAPAGIPPACPSGQSLVAVGSNNGSFVLPTTPGRPYTVVFSTLNGGPLATLTGAKQWGVYIIGITSLANGTLPSTTTTGLTTGGTTGSNRTTTGLTATTGTSSTSGAGAIGVPVLLAAAALLHFIL